jgi:hypothetical protein
MEALWDRNGDPIGWLEENVIYDTNDRYRAVVVDGDIYQLGTSRFIGRYERGIIWDRNGMAVACGPNGTPPPTLPELKTPPPDIQLEKPSDTSVSSRASMPLNLTDRWSQRTWVRFLDGG